MSLLLAVVLLLASLAVLAVAALYWIALRAAPDDEARDDGEGG